MKVFILVAAFRYSIRVCNRTLWIDRFERRVLADAVGQSKQNAETLARAASVELGDILRIEYGWTEIRFSERAMTYEVGEAGGQAAMPDIEPAEIEAGDSVTVVWAIET